MGRLHRRTVAVCLVLILAATPAVAGVRVVGDHPTTRKHAHFGFDFEPHVAFSRPTGDAGRAFDHGIDGGLSVTSMQSRRVGIGLDVGYQHWPSPKGGVALDEFVNSFGGTPISGTNVFVDQFDVSAHLRLTEPDQFIIPFLDLGVGMVRANGAIEYPTHVVSGPLGTLILTDSHHVSTEPEVSVRVGIDVSSQKGVRVGPDLSYKWIFFGSESTPFTALGIGAHARFGSW